MTVPLKNDFLSEFYRMVQKLRSKTRILIRDENKESEKAEVYSKNTRAIYVIEKI